MVLSTRSGATETSAAWRRSWSSFPLGSVVVPSIDCPRLCRDRSLQRAPEPQSTTKCLSSPIDDFNLRLELTEASVHPDRAGSPPSDLTLGRSRAILFPCDRGRGTVELICSPHPVRASKSPIRPP